MKLQDLGFNTTLETYRKDNDLESFEAGRVIAAHRDRYVVKTEQGEFNSELIGNLRFNAESSADLPAVGDWVSISEYDEGKALIHAVYPRYSIIQRQAVGKSGQKQIIATNIDYGLIMQAVNRDFNINRIERYLAICNTSNVEPILLLNKVDLIDTITLDSMLGQIKDRISDVLIIPMSNQANIGLNKIRGIIVKGKTYCLLGSSGVGKSTLLNNLTGEVSMSTGAISEGIDRGKHITSHRELVLLKEGGIIIDNPGMREVGIADAGAGLEITFESIFNYAQNCKFKNCSHTHEQGCAVTEAVADGNIDNDSYENFLKMEKEKIHFESTTQERRQKDKDFGKMIKNVLKNKKKIKF